jgi:hypothetical protein
LLSYDKLSRKPLLFKSFKGLSVQQFDEIFKEIQARYDKYEINRLSSRKERRERAVGAGRRFKLVMKDRVIMVLVLSSVHHLHPDGISIWFGWTRVTYAGRDIQKIERLIRRCLPIPQKLYKVTKRLKTKEEIEKYFPGFLAFTDCTEQPTHSKTSKEQEEKKTILFRQEKETHTQSRTCIQHIRRA